ncbi:hypothetical protein BTVI_22623 [Pitangus sulphuratus]|nr:hypothetical protein BTVI_22623 [Pitangus sulphuratus]
MKELKCEIAEFLAKMFNLSSQTIMESGARNITTVSPIHKQGSREIHCVFRLCLKVLAKIFVSEEMDDRAYGSTLHPEVFLGPEFVPLLMFTEKIWVVAVSSQCQTQMQNLVLVLVEPREVSTEPSIEHIHAPFDGILSLIRFKANFKDKIREARNCVTQKNPSVTVPPKNNDILPKIKDCHEQLAVDLISNQKKSKIRPGQEDTAQIKQPSSPELWRSSKDCTCCEEDEDQEERIPKDPRPNSRRGMSGSELGRTRGWINLGLDRPYYKIVEPLPKSTHIVCFPLGLWA